jgi:hypothetical protein
LDYCNGLFYGLPHVQLAELQRVQNAAARLVASVNRRRHITPILKELLWLAVKFRVMFKILLLVFKCIHSAAPDYLQDLITVTCRNQHRYSLRSTDEVLLEYPRGSCRNLCLAAALKLWNALSPVIRGVLLLGTFKKQLN